ncbi:MAG: OB-fold domain-containing protein, partial [Actinobacteria bacterium]|nr:OB-fold domain-containing protein [Actinomycetota bacterium]
AGREFEDVPLARTGKVWSYTENRYQPPPPYMSPDPFVPYVIAAVELDDDKIVVMGQVVAGVGVDDLKIGMPMELTVDTLFEDDEAEQLVWKWQPAGGSK